MCPRSFTLNRVNPETASVLHIQRGTTHHRNLTAASVTNIITFVKMLALEKGTFRPATGHEGLEVEKRYSSTLSLTSVLQSGGWLTPRPGRFTLGKETRYPFYRKLGGPEGRSERMRKISPPSGFDLRAVESVATFSVYMLNDNHYLPHTYNVPSLILC